MQDSISWGEIVFVCDVARKQVAVIHGVTTGLETTRDPSQAEEKYEGEEETGSGEEAVQCEAGCQERSGTVCEDEFRRWNIEPILHRILANLSAPL